MSDPGATHYRWEDLPKEALKPDLARRLISTERMMLAHVYLDKGCIVPKHSHENEQLTYILEGVLRFWLGEDESEVVDVAAAALHHLDLLKATGTFYTGPPPLPSAVGTDGVGRLDGGRRVYFDATVAPYGSMAERALVAEEDDLMAKQGSADLAHHVIRHYVRQIDTGNLRAKRTRNRADLD